MKKVIWGFWGCGKSTVADGVKIIDADCGLFKYVGVNTENLHTDFHDKEKFYKNLDYPENYVAFVQKCEAEIVLVNCELSVLSRFDSVCLYYPSQSRKDEFIRRYIQRGDNQSFISFMKEEYEGILRTLSITPYPKYVAVHGNTYLSDLLKSGGEIDMSGFMTKKEIVNLMDKAKWLNVEYIEDLQDMNSDKIAQKLFEGELNLDIEQLQQETSKAQKEYEDSFCGTYVYEDNKKVQAIQVVRGFGNQKDEIWVRERKGREDEAYAYYGFRIFNKDGILLENMEKFQSMLNKGFEKTNEKFEVGTIEKNDLKGFSHKEAVDIVMDAIAMGVIQAHHGEIYPYSFGFEYSYKGHGAGKGNFNPFEYPERVIRKIELNEFACLPLHEINQDIEKARKEYDITKITPYKTTTEYRRKQTSSWERGLIANYRYVRQGYAVDGIIEGSCHGDYSSITTNRQNEWMQAVVPLRGYCLDYVYEAAGGTKYLPYLEEIVKYYQTKGIDVTNEDFICEWINQNRDKCYFEENRTQVKNIVPDIENNSLDEEEMER